MEIQGKIKLIGETQEFGSKGFRKRDLVVTTSEQYPQHILVEFIQDKSELLDAYSIGQDVKVSLNLRGREWTSPQGEVKYFNTIQGWRIEAITVEENPQKGKQEYTEPLGNQDEGDLPF
jgi:hypothetical protein